MAKNKFVLGALIGAAAGVVAGILSAPKSGKETRADIKRKAFELKTEANKKASDVKREAEQRGADLKEQASTLKNRVESHITDAKDGFSKKPLGSKSKK